MVRASASQSVDLGLISLVKSYQKTLKNSVLSFPAWCWAFKRGGEQAGKFACCVLGQGTQHINRAVFLLNRGLVTERASDCKNKMPCYTKCRSEIICYDDI